MAYGVLRILRNTSDLVGADAYGVWRIAYLRNTSDLVGADAYGVWRMRMAYWARMAYGVWRMAYGVWRICQESEAYC